MAIHQDLVGDQGLEPLTQIINPKNYYEECLLRFLCRLPLFLHDVYIDVFFHYRQRIIESTNSHTSLRHHQRLAICISFG